MRQPYYRIWRPGSGTEFCSDHRNTKNLPEISTSYIRLENQFRRVLTKHWREMEQAKCQYQALLRHSVFEIQQNIYDLLRANGVAATAQICAGELELVVQHLRLEEYTVELHLPSGCFTCSPYLQEQRAAWDLPRLHGRFSAFVPLGAVTLRQCVVALAALRVLLYAQFGDALDDIMQGKSKKQGSGFYTPRSILSLKQLDWPEEEKYEFCWKELSQSKQPFARYPFL